MTLDARLWLIPGWVAQGLAAIAEGFCPYQHGPLGASADPGVRFVLDDDKRFRPGGWCAQCGVWYHVDNGSEYPLVAYYPVPGTWTVAVAP